MYHNERVDTFLNEYKRLERIAVERYGFPDDGTAVSKLEKQSEFRKYKAELSYCREVRNLLQHNPKLADSFAVEPSDEMIRLLMQTIEKINNPPKAIDIAIPRRIILSKSMTDLVRPTMIEMQKNNYTHIPIIEHDVVVGVFSENTVLSYLIDDEIIEIGDDVCFTALGKYLPIENHSSESFRFISRNASLQNVNELFEKALRSQDRIGLVFVTQNGKPSEKLLGIISAWDAAAKE